MSRRKGRKRRQRPAQRPGDVYLRFDGGGRDGERLRVPGFSADDYRRLQKLACAGQLADPLIMQFILAFAAALECVIDPETWTLEETAGLLRWLEITPPDAWTVLDDLEFAWLAGGAS